MLPLIVERSILGEDRLVAYLMESTIGVKQRDIEKGQENTSLLYII